MTSRRFRTAPRLAIGLAIATAVTSLPLGGLAASATSGLPAVGQPAAKLVFPPTITALVSATPTGGPGNGTAQGASVSGNGQFVTWSDMSSNLVPDDTNGARDTFVRDMVSDVTERVNVSSDGVQANLGNPSNPSISRDGRYVAFTSYASNLVSGDTNSQPDIFVRDRKTDSTERVSVSGGLVQGNSISNRPAISGNGRFVAFASSASNLVTGDTNDSDDVFVRDRQLGTITRVSLSSAEAQAGNDSGNPAISNDGRFVTFTSVANNLVAGDGNGSADVFERDLIAGTTIRISVGANGTQGNLPSGDDPSPVSDDGKYVAFTSISSTLAPNIGSSTWHVFRRDLNTGTTVGVSVSGAGVQASAISYQPSMSADGNLITFGSGADALVTGDTNDHGDVFQRNVTSGTTVRQSLTSTGAQLALGGEPGGMSADGSTLGFASGSHDVVATPAGAGTMFVRSKQLVAPFSTVDGLIHQQRTDFGLPQLTPAESGAQVTKILSGFPSYQRYVADLSRSAAWSGARAPVTRLYWAFFLRAPDTGGLDYWIKKIQGGAKLNTVALQFSQSPEFKNKYGKLTNGEFVGLVYVNVLGRASDAAGQAHWEAKLGGGMTRGQMMTAFSESSEGIRKLSTQTDVVVLSLAMLRVVPTHAQLNAWRTIILGGGTLEDVVTQVLATPAYGARITP